MPSIVIPAHDEERALARTLPRLLAGLRGDVEVVVVANGCADRTAEVARELAPAATVVELEAGGKPGALRAGEAVSRGGLPRLYVDADVDLDGPGANAVLAALEGGAPGAEPTAQLDTSGSGPLVRAWYAVWRALHGGRPGAIGPGLYGLSSAGRARFEDFPDVIADDGFVRAHFAPDEIVRPVGVTSRVVAPRTVGDLIRIKTRSRLGNLELQQRFPELWASKRAASGALSGKAAGLPLKLWPLAPWYLALTLWIRRRARRLSADLEGYVWERDEGSRA